MSSARTDLPLLWVVLIVAIATAWPVRTWLIAKSDTRQAHRDLEQAMGVDQNLNSLLAAAMPFDRGKAASDDLAALIRGALRDEGIGSQVLEDVVPRLGLTPVQVGRDKSFGWRGSAAVVRVRPMPLVDLGRFLTRWRRNHPEWIATSVELRAHESSRGVNPNTQQSAGPQVMSYSLLLQLERWSFEVSAKP